MSSVSSTGTITSLGTGSGLDLENLLTNLVDAQKEPQETLIKNKTDSVNAKISALGSLQSQLSDFQSSLSSLKSDTSFNVKTATSSNTASFTATATKYADNSSYQIEVVQLAQANKVTSGTFSSSSAAIGTGTLTIGVGNASFDVDIDSSNNTVSGIVDAINSASGNSGVKASMLTVSDGNGGTQTRLVLTATTTGASSQISVSVADSDGNNTDNSGLSQLYYLKSDTTNSRFTETYAAQDAKITVDGYTATSSTNTFSNTIKGLTITATAPTSSAGTLKVSTDSSSVKSSIEDFVSSYNELIKSFKTNAGYDSSTQTAAALYGDGIVSLMQTRVRQTVSGDVSNGTNGIDNLASIGITTNSDGTLSIDDTKLSNALENNYDDVATLFSGSDGIAAKLDTSIKSFLQSGGTIDTQQTTLNKQLSALEDQTTRLNERMDKFEAMYRAKFSALDTLISSLNSTSDYLTEQFAAMSSSED